MYVSANILHENLHVNVAAMRTGILTDIKSLLPFQVKNLLSRLDVTNQRLQEAQIHLMCIEGKRGFNLKYFRDQWSRKKAQQLDVISKKRQKYLEELGELLDLEEKLVEAQ